MRPLLVVQDSWELLLFVDRKGRSWSSHCTVRTVFYTCLLLLMGVAISAWLGYLPGTTLTVPFAGIVITVYCVLYRRITVGERHRYNVVHP